MTRLTAPHDDLYLNKDILLVIYPAGDCDTIPWPMKTDSHKAMLAAALFDAYETGQIKEREVLLPDGTKFDIDSNLNERLLESQEY